MNATTASFDSFGLGHLLASNTSLESALRFDSGPSTTGQSEHGHNSTSPDSSPTSATTDASTAVDLTIFDGFKDFDLDLSCLSSPPSPSSSATELPLSTSPTPSGSSYHSGIHRNGSPSPPPQLPPPSVLITPGLSPQSPRTFGRSLGYKASTVSTYKHTANSTVSHLSAVAAATTNAVRGSWPLMKYVGRGTPIDRNRRIEWGGLSSEEVAEDGVLFTTVRSTSLDSNHRPSEGSVSPEWNYVSPPGSHSGHQSGSYYYPHGSVSSSVHLTRSATVSATFTTTSSSSSPNVFAAAHEGGDVLDITAPAPAVPLPESARIQIEGLGSDHSAEWESIIQTVLETAASASASIVDVTSNGNGGGQMVLLDAAGADVVGVEDGQVEGAAGSQATDANGDGDGEDGEDELALDTSALDMDLGLDKALDLGLGIHGGMNWFNLGIIPSSSAATQPAAAGVDAHRNEEFDDDRSEVESAGLAGIGAGGGRMRLKDKDGADTPSVYSMASQQVEPPPGSIQSPRAPLAKLPPPPIPARSASRRYTSNLPLTSSTLSQKKAISESHFELGRGPGPHLRPHSATEMRSPSARSASPPIPSVLTGAKSDDHHSSRTGSSKTETNVTRGNKVSTKGSSSKSERADCDRGEEDEMDSVGVGIGKGIGNVANVGIGIRGRTSGTPWWRKVFQRFKHVKVLIRTQSNHV